MRSASRCPVARASARVGKCEDDELAITDLIHNRKWGAIQHGNSAVVPIFPLRRRVWKLEDRFENSIDLVFELGSEPDAARLVIVNLVIDLGDREPMDSKLQ